MRWRPLTIALLVASAITAVTACDVGASAVGAKGSKSLHELARKHRKYIGNAVDNNEIKDAEYADLVAAEVGSVTPMNAMKWDATEPRPGKFDFARADEIMDLTEQSGQSVRGHTLAWHSQTRNGCGVSEPTRCARR